MTTATNDLAQLLETINRGGYETDPELRRGIVEAARGLLREYADQRTTHWYNTMNMLDMARQHAVDYPNVVEPMGAALLAMQMQTIENVKRFAEQPASE